MINNALDKIIVATPNKIHYHEIVDLNGLDERIAAVGVLYANTIGVCDGYIEFCPDNDPPRMEEILSWIWICRPDLSADLLKQSKSMELNLLIESYQAGDMNKWWDHINMECDK